MLNNEFGIAAERNVRRKAATFGLLLHKQRAVDDPGYMLVDGVGSYVVAGGDPIVFSLTLPEAANWLAAHRDRLATV